MTVVDAGVPDGDGLDEGGFDADGLHAARLHAGRAAEHIHGICLKTGPPRRVGVELEWLVRDARDPALPVPAGRIADAVAAFDAEWVKRDQEAPGADRDQGPLGEDLSRARLPTSSHAGVLPSGAPLTTEPGGQLELSSLPADSLPELVSATRSDLAALRGAVGDAGLELAGIGLDPLRPPRRILDLPRYAAMEAFFDRGGPWGRQMMCGTASVQVCLDAGDDSDGPSGYRWRWQLVHAIGPVLVAAFANSPLREGRPTGWASSRQQIWARMDPGRTRPPRLDGDPRAAWAAYALDAELMCVRDPDSADWSAPPGLTLRDWVGVGTPSPASDGPTGNSPPGNGSASDSPPGNGSAGSGPPGNGSASTGHTAHGLRPPALDDLGYHLSTLFPPVRPRGHFELRMIDAQPGDGWIVPLAVSWALLSDAQAGEAALAAVAPIWDGRPPGPGGTDDDRPWLRAARCGPADAEIARASRQCFAVAREALDRTAIPAEITAAVDAFHARYVSKDRCPADDILENAE